MTTVRDAERLSQISLCVRMVLHGSLLVLVGNSIEREE
jgi:hypothetical protein